MFLFCIIGTLPMKWFKLLQYTEITINHSVLEVLEPLIEQISIRHNLTSSLMFMGIFLGYFLSFVIFLKAKKESPIVLFGWGLLVQSIVCTDTYLCYTGLIKYALHLNDSTEPLVLLIPATIYFFVYALLVKKPIAIKTHWWHFLIPALYAITQIGYYISPLSVKLNAYIDAYYQNPTFAKTPDSYNYSYHIIKDEFRWIILFVFVFYIILG